MIRNYKNIKAWQIANRLVREVYKTTKEFPRDELYGLISQLRRATVSVATNITEGSSRKHKNDYLHFLYIAKGSLSETEYLIQLSHDLKYLDKNMFDETYKLCRETGAVLYGLIRAIENIG